jgi:hypothetical protein
MDIIEEVEWLIKEHAETQKQIKELEKHEEDVYKLLAEKYLEYIRARLTKKCENGEGYYFDTGTMIVHCNKFKGFDYCGKGDKYTYANKPYGNEHDAIFKFDEGFYTDWTQIAQGKFENPKSHEGKNRLTVGIHQHYYTHDEEGYHSGYAFGKTIYLDVGILTKKEYEKAKSNWIKKIEDAKNGEFDGYKVGDKVRWSNGYKIYTGTIALIHGKSAYMTNGTKITLTRTCLEKITD